MAVVSSIIHKLETGEIKKYTIDMTLGNGNYGTVYKVHDDEGHIHALKWLHPNVYLVFQRAQREYTTTQKLNHPHIVVPKAKFQYMDQTYLLMDYIEGKNLQEVLKEKRVFELEETLKIGTNLLNVLAYMHSNDMAHRDIKPSNIIMGKDGPVLVDFGLIWCATDQETLTGTGDGLGTRAYSAPELSKGRPKGGGDYYLSDMYSVGAVLYELLAGERPEPYEGLKKIRGRLRPLKKYLKKRDIERPEEISKVIMKALHTNPSKRFTSYESFTEALTKIYTYEKKIEEKKQIVNNDVVGLNEPVINFVKDFFYFPISCCKYFASQKRIFLHRKKYKKEMEELEEAKKIGDMVRIRYRLLLCPYELPEKCKKFELNYPTFSKIIKKYFGNDSLRNDQTQEGVIDFVQNFFCFPVAFYEYYSSKKEDKRKESMGQKRHRLLLQPDDIKLLEKYKKFESNYPMFSKIIKKYLDTN